MGDIVKGVLGGGWSLLVGWILPTAINLLVFGFFVMPGLPWPSALDTQTRGLVLLVAAAVVGLLLASLQTPLFRLLEGYVGWRPAPSGRVVRDPWNAWLHWLRKRQLRRRRELKGRLDLIDMTATSEREGGLREALRERFAQVQADPLVRKHAERDLRRTSTQRGLLRERAGRYPVNEDQVVPTRLGNAIRRLEEYGYDRYRLDSQTLWYELYSTASEVARKQVEQARTTVDFFVCLLYGHLFVALAALIQRRWVVTIVLVLLAFWWYERAIKSTDDWAAATRALVNSGRKSLAAALGLNLPPTLEKERAMWAGVSRVSQRPFDERSAGLDEYRKTDL